MQPCLHLTAPVGPRPHRPAEFQDDVHFSEDLVEHFLLGLTAPGDVVLDPFVGFGTTLDVAARLGRRGIGIEVLDDRAAAVAKRHPGAVITGDARHLADLVEPPVHLVITSPPYMTSIEHPQNPLTGYRTLDGDYDHYLDELADVFRQTAHVVVPGGHIVINVANIRTGAHITPLAWDVARVVARELQLVREIVLCWEGAEIPYFTNEYCFVFRAAD